MRAVPSTVLEAALEDAAKRTGTAQSALKVLVAEAVTWPDGSLGCPKPGMLYTQALVPGYRVVVQAGAEKLEYHASSRGQPAFCPPGRSTAALPSERT